jgi:anti-sigma regulatory factor (Ser/Thr protein kinase)
MRHPPTRTGNDRPVRAGSGTANDVVRLAPVSSNVAVARRFVAESFARAAGLDPTSELCADLALVASELVTNAVEHGDRRLVEVSVALDGAVCVLAVTSHGAGRMPPTDDWRITEASSLTGRGLGVVRALVDSVELLAEGDRTTVVVRRHTG